MIICSVKPIDPVLIVFAGAFLLAAIALMWCPIKWLIRDYKAANAPDPEAPETHEAYKGYMFKVTVVTLNDGTVRYFPVVRRPGESKYEESIVSVDPDWYDGTRVWHLLTSHFTDGKYSFSTKNRALAELNRYKLELIKQWERSTKNIVEIVTT